MCIEWKVLEVSLRTHEVARVTLVSLHNNAAWTYLCQAYHVHSYSGRAARWWHESLRPRKDRNLGWNFGGTVIFVGSFARADETLVITETREVGEGGDSEGNFEFLVSMILRGSAWFDMVVTVITWNYTLIWLRHDTTISSLRFVFASSVKSFDPVAFQFFNRKSLKIFNFCSQFLLFDSGLLFL